MKKLNDILQGIKVLEIIGNKNISIKQVAFDSRKVTIDTLFVAVKGTVSDGHNYIDSSIANGASVVVCETIPEQRTEGIIYIKVENSAKALGNIASNFYGRPSENINLIGVTGTNGKTTIATLLYKLVRKLGYKAGLISTIENFIEDKVVRSTHTTPDPVQINSLLSDMVDAGCEYCFMEVSSHACVQGRIDGLKFKGGIFTNITHDHLDYHKDFDNYIKAKQIFFNQLSKDSFALTNIDDRNGEIIIQNSVAKRYSYALKSMSDFKTRIIERHLDGMLLRISDHDLWVRLIGTFNAYNITAIYATAVLCGFNEREILVELSIMEPVNGRFEVIRSADNITAIVDYAHTPDALKNVLQTIQEINQDNGDIITVVGTGGNRDKTKRPVMANIASRLSNKVIFTADNPRNEKPEAIIDDMMKGVDADKIKNVLRIVDRKEAIRTALMIAKERDIVLVAGKGHETYQEINGERFHFDDHEEILKTFNNQ